MNQIRNERVWQHVVGESRPREITIGAVVGLLILSSCGFVIGMEVGLSLGWIVMALGIAFVAGVVGAGLVPTIGSLWLIGLWWFVFPPLVGYLGGGWADASRYNHPRMMGFAYTSARAELIGGIEYGLRYGILFAVLGGTIAYITGTSIQWFATRLRARR